MSRRSWISVSAIVAAAFASAPAFGEKHYNPGITDTDIKLGQTVPYSGPVSAYDDLRQGVACVFCDDQRKRRRQRSEDRAAFRR